MKCTLYLALVIWDLAAGDGAGGGFASGIPGGRWENVCLERAVGVELPARRSLNRRIITTRYFTLLDCALHFVI